MKAAIFNQHGLENLKIIDIPIPEVKDNHVLIKIIKVGNNPIDYFSVSGFYGLNTEKKLTSFPMPHIAGMEISGIIEKVGNSVTGFEKDDHVIVYNRIFDSICDQCINGREMLCRNGSLIGIGVNGGFAEYITVPCENVIKIPRSLDWNLASSLPVCALTAYHALNLSDLSADEILVVFGASGSTGLFVTQFGVYKKAKVIAVTRKKWLTQFGADHVVFNDDNLFNQVLELTKGKLSDVVVNSIGKETWSKGLELLNYNGRLLTFGVLTGNLVELDIQPIYLKQIKIIGSNGGTRKELQDVVKLSHNLKTKVWKEFSLNQIREALQCLFDKGRDGRIMLNCEM
ncbi:MAG TPA: alcohol dehydrogenase catalytic domain-containing protein [Nitrososphaeraceae archaeon]|jgi:NADPH:quinone reductase-like Zn-dependent oxidoreductase|nr:alcohol dehydrogenase catalytic domain-containing protein [Nitrososphaeraceae archaeon]